MTETTQRSLLAALLPLIRQEKLTVRQLVLMLFLQNEASAPDFGNVKLALQISGPALCRAVEKLSILGMIRSERNSFDRRRVFIGLTPKGRKFVKEIVG